MTRVAGESDVPPDIFETERLVVRRASPTADLDALLAIFGDPVNTAQFGGGRPWSEDEVRQFLAGYPERDPQLVSTPGLALLRPGLEPVGFGGVGYYVAPSNTAELFFIFRHQFWGRGLATELARAAVEAAFRRPEVEVVQATVKPSNGASRRVLEKCGMTEVRYLPGAARVLYRLERPMGRPGRQAAA